MDMKHYLLLVAIVMVTAQLSAQEVKRSFKDVNDGNTTVVIKASKEKDDIEILNEQFDIEEFRVGEVIRITTDEPMEVAPIPSPKRAKVKPLSTRKKGKQDVFTYKGTSFNKKKRRKKDKAVYTFNNEKSKKRSRAEKRCYEF